MTAPPIDFKKANGYLPHIFLIGIGIGTANYIINTNFNWVQWMILSLSTSMLIGYTLVVIASNRSWFQFHFRPTWKLLALLTFAFFFAGVFATEVEQAVRALVFQQEKYDFFSAGGMYLFNGIIALILGFSFFQNENLFSEKVSNSEKTIDPQETESEEVSSTKNPITQVPIKQGENILLIPVEDIVYFEAFDNYSFVYNGKGEKKLCDYSLLFLGQRLDGNFLRIHRKYIINVNHIKQISPHSNGRYAVQFKAAKLSPINSSKSYLPIIRKLIKIE